MSLTGSSTAEIHAPLDRVWDLVQDVGERSRLAGRPERDARAGSRRRGPSDPAARPRPTPRSARSSRSSASPTTGQSGSPGHQEKGDLKSVKGSWELEDLGGERTRATYSIDVDLGRTLGLIVRGPVVDVLRHMLAGARAGELKKRIEKNSG